jgi:hypothetical protein
LRRAFGSAFEEIEIDSSQGNPWGIPLKAHAVLTDAFVDEQGHPTRAARDAVLSFLREKLLPATRYYAYLELADPRSSDHPSSLWAEYERVAQDTDNLAMKRASQRDQIYPVFRELFRKESQ